MQHERNVKNWGKQLFFGVVKKEKIIILKCLVWGIPPSIPCLVKVCNRVSRFYSWSVNIKYSVNVMNTGSRM